MNYEKQSWKDGDLITASKLNNIEDAIQLRNPDYNKKIWVDKDTITANALNKIENGIMTINPDYVATKWKFNDIISSDRLCSIEDGISHSDSIPKTSFFSDGTLIINEDPKNRDNDIALHGDLVTEHYAGNDGHPWTNYSNDIFSVKIGTPLKVYDVSGWFSGLENCTTIDLTGLDTSECISFSWMFNGAHNLTSIIGLDTMNTSSAVYMEYMFAECRKLTSIDVSNFDTSSVTDMHEMFLLCSLLTSIDVSNFDTSSVTNMESMFSACFNLVSIVASDKFTIDSVTNSTNMFNKSSKLVGGNGTVYDSTKVDKTYARIDTAETPGYFTAAS